MRRHLARLELLAREDLLVRVDVRRHADDGELVERALHPRDGLRPVAAPGDDLREQRVVERRDLVALQQCVSSRIPGPAGGSHVVSTPVDGLKFWSASSALMRHSIAWPFTQICSSEKLSGLPSASAICSFTRSMPVTASVTVCSTWMRAFTSMKYGLPAASTRNSNVPTPREPKRFAASTAMVLIRRRSSSLIEIHGAPSS